MQSLQLGGLERGGGGGGGQVDLARLEGLPGGVLRLVRFAGDLGERSEVRAGQVVEVRDVSFGPKVG